MTPLITLEVHPGPYFNHEGFTLDDEQTLHWSRSRIPGLVTEKGDGIREWRRGCHLTYNNRAREKSFGNYK